MKSAPRVVLDTNVVLSALLFAHGRQAPLRMAWHRAAIRPLVSTATTEELIRVLAYPKFKLNESDQEELLGDYLPYCTTVAMPDKPPRTPDCRDPDDIKFLQLAVIGKADYLVTGDRDLLEIKGRFACPIIGTGEFKEKLRL